MEINQSPITYLSISLASVIIGFVLGYISRGALDKNIRQKVDFSSYVLIVVTTIWAVSMIIDILSPAYETSPLVHAMMGGIVGFFYKPNFGVTSKKK